ncbi:MULTISPECIES: hypothetical protein [unclassified Rhizobium]|uniref:hypothetical protein n=1 Tax=unclassified Rhizobium TaxID=2613769 RepID=UPI0007EA1B37|nr:MULTISPECIES: hypothetical protein [unclassified Rhizobium]ANM13365.1 hypothetical protein AMK05_PB00227 [Rhizobium sp. N324]ANM19765.1 hypothetical protein AMK06_PB00229 [Rhizobium sp. N541]ANM26150.1 hypothetical protein AMK07_PB00229 [Rhizobium sp. N941]OYD01155.1 hypothetical protein AMK08_PB00225 [Rhizobium sp. N4311]
MTETLQHKASQAAVHSPAGLADYFDTLPFLGRLTCQRPTLIAGDWTELELVYEVGAVGLADGAWLKLAFKFYSDWALFQTTDPTGANYVSAEYHAGPLVPGQSPATVQALKVRFDQKGHERPFQKAIIIDVVDGYINPGDRIVIRLGDRRQGGAGTRVQTFVEKAFQFRLFIDPLGSSKFAEVPGDCKLEILAGQPHALQIIAPRLVGLDQSFDAIVRVDDIWGNTCRDRNLRGTLVITAPDATQRTEPIALATADWTFARISGLSFTETGEWKLEARLDDEPFVTAAVAYMQSEEEALRPLYADLHVHSDDTVGTNDATYNLTYGRDIAGLDVVGYTVNDFNITEKNWDKAVEIIHGLNEPGRFVCYPGTEWCGNSAAGGDRNVVFLRDGKPRFPFDKEGRSLRSFEWNETTAGTIRPGIWPVDRLHAAYEDDPEGHLLIPHVGGRRCILDWNHPELERLIEIGSAWGQFHWLYTEALARGYRVGASAASDEHQGRCGGGAPATGTFGSRGGLTGVIADRFDRAGVGSALRARRTFATTGERSFAVLSQGQHFMGEVFDAEPEKPLSYRLLGQAGWEEIQLYDGDRLVWRRDLHAETGFSERSLRIRFGGARIKDRYRAAYWSGAVAVTGAALLDARGVGFDHPEQSVWRTGLGTLGFRTATHGDVDGIELKLSDLNNAHITIAADLHGYSKIGDPLQPPPHVHAPEARLELNGKDLIAKGSVTLDLPGVELRLIVERVTDQPLPRDLAGEILLRDLTLDPEREHPLFITARQRDQSRIWTSPLFLTPR